ncbi:hypothetical protein Tco_0522189 [Tanacetum coccineum]
MVACLEKSEGNTDFHEIVDFLTASSVHYALTVSPTIYASYIEQFWNTAHSQTVNDVKQIHATVDGKTVVISESSVRSDLHFNDEDGITCLTNDAIFENLALMGYESDSNKLTFQKALFFPQWKYLIHTILHCLSSKSTSWNEFSTNIASAVICLANGQKFNFSKLIFDEPFNDVYQTPEHTKKVLTNLKRKGKYFSGRVTPLFASMLAPPVVEVQDEAIFKEWDGRVVRATTTAATLDATQASGDRPRGNTPGSDEERIKQDDLKDFVPPTPHDSPLLGGHTPRSDEGRPNINELMAICTNLSNRVLALEQSKTAQDLVIRKLKKKVRKLEKKLRARTPGMKLFKIGTSRRKSLDKENVSKQGRKSDKTKPMFDDSDFAELDVDNAMENVEGDAKTQGRNTTEQITTVGDTVNTTSIDVSAAGPSNVSTADPSTNTARDIFEDEMMIIIDTLVAIRGTRPRTTSIIIHDVEEEPKRSTPAPTVQPSSKDKGKVHMVEPKKPPKNPRKAQIQMDKQLAIRLHEEEKAELERMQRERAAQEEASNDALIAEFDNVQARMEADALLATRFQEKEREQFSIDKQARFLVETISERKKIKDFIPMDSEEGGKKAASSKKRPRAEPDEESVKRQKIREASGSDNDDILWKLQRYMHDHLVWRLYDTCGVHHVSSVRGHDIFMLVEKEYPLTRGTLGLTMVARLLVEADSKISSRELLRKIFYQANRPRQ